MKYISIATIALFLFAACGQAEVETETSNDPIEVVTPEPVTETYSLSDGSSLTWVGYEDGNEEGHNHSGTVSIKSGSCLLYTSPSPRDRQKSRMPSAA